MKILIPLKDIMIAPGKRFDPTEYTEQDVITRIKKLYGVIAEVMDIVVEGEMIHIEFRDATLEKYKEAMEKLHKGVKEAQKGQLVKAFEVEHSTSIYSGLLRFSDLKIVAPNSMYPLFIVAPLSQRNRLKEQINRPTFKKMDFSQKVRYLSYETVKEIDKFFEESSSGLSAELLFGKSEAIA